MPAALSLLSTTSNTVSLSLTVPHELVQVSSCCTWFSALALCLLGCPVFFWIPFCVPTGKDTVHRCGHCNTCLGRHNFGGL